MNYKKLVEMDLKMLQTLTDINPEYQKFIDRMAEYVVEDKQDYDKYLEIKELFIQEQQEDKQDMIIELQKWKFGSR